MKKQSVFYNPQTITTIRTHCARKGDNRLLRQKTQAAAWWMEKSYDELWALMFAPTLKRSWMVRSDARCPSCGAAVPMYNWKIDAQRTPWKVGCPHCGALFPKNDFGAYYNSGLDAQGVFRYEHAHVNLLDVAQDGQACSAWIDDGNGCADAGGRMMFIGTYLVYGQWKQLVVDGIHSLAEAYVVSGEIEYARRALILLDRVADLFPGFDYTEQGVMYEEEGTSFGYVSYWAGSCSEVRSMAAAYDRIFDAVRTDHVVCAYLRDQAQRYGLACAKSDFGEIQHHIEERIFINALQNQKKIHMNFPYTELTVLTIEAVLDWPQNREKLLSFAGDMIARATAVDGLTGEKGTCTYAAIGPSTLASFLCMFAGLDASLPALLTQQYPSLLETFRFHMDTWCLERYYPGCGDMNAPGLPVPTYGNTILQTGKLDGRLYMSTESLFWQLYEITGDPNFARVIYLSNGRSAQGCFSHDVTVPDAAAREAELEALVERCGACLTQESVLKKAWRLALFHAGTGEDRRCAWVDYDSGGPHGHDDALNMGLMAYGLDLMPDFGYPPVNHGGWSSKEFYWYHRPSSHNLVEVDGKRHTNRSFTPAYGECTLWDVGEHHRAGYFRAPEYPDVRRYERLLAMIDLSPSASYCFDVFRVEGGRLHARFIRSTFGTLQNTGLRLSPGEPYGHDSIMRGFMRDDAPPLGWRADFAVRDIYHVRESEEAVHLCYIDLTEGAAVTLCESWIDESFVASSHGNIPENVFESEHGLCEAWIPTVIQTREGEQGLFSVFAGLYIPYVGECPVVSARRLPLTDAQGRAAAASHVGVEVALASGEVDILLARDPALGEDVFWGPYSSEGRDFTWIRREAE